MSEGHAGDPTGGVGQTGGPGGWAVRLASHGVDWGCRCVTGRSPSDATQLWSDVATSGWAHAAWL